MIGVKGSEAFTKFLASVNASFELDGRRYDCVVNVVMVTTLQSSSEGWRITNREDIDSRDRFFPLRLQSCSVKSIFLTEGLQVAIWIG